MTLWLRLRTGYRATLECKGAKYSRSDDSLIRAERVEVFSSQLLKSGLPTCRICSGGITRKPDTILPGGSDKAHSIRDADLWGPIRRNFFGFESPIMANVRVADDPPGTGWRASNDRTYFVQNRRISRWPQRFIGLFGSLLQQAGAG